MAPLLARLDAWLYRRPFEGRSARRYADLQRQGFGDLDERLLALLAPELARARRFLDLGAGPGDFARRLAERRPDLEVVAVEPSAAYAARFARAAAPPRLLAVRAAAEALPLPGGAFDLALGLSSIRHVADRRAALAELRRVLAPGGAAYLVELDPEATPAQVRRHARAVRSLPARVAFGPLVVRTAPRWTEIARAARAAGFAEVEHRADPEQPLYLLRLSGARAR